MNQQFTYENAENLFNIVVKRNRHIFIAANLTGERKIQILTQMIQLVSDAYTQQCEQLGQNQPVIPLPLPPNVLGNPNAPPSEFIKCWRQVFNFCKGVWKLLNTTRQTYMLMRIGELFE